jgi:hypothetical protein
VLAHVWQPLSADDQQPELCCAFRAQHDEEALDVLQAGGLLLIHPRSIQKENIASLEDIGFGFARTRSAHRFLA